MADEPKTLEDDPKAVYLLAVDENQARDRLIAWRAATDNAAAAMIAEGTAGSLVNVHIRGRALIARGARIFRAEGQFDRIEITEVSV